MLLYKKLLLMTFGTALVYLLMSFIVNTRIYPEDGGTDRGTHWFLRGDSDHVLKCKNILSLER